jgi:hypothetical protein
LHLVRNAQFAIRGIDPAICNPPPPLTEPQESHLARIGVVHQRFARAVTVVVVVRLR